MSTLDELELIRRIIARRISSDEVEDTYPGWTAGKLNGYELGLSYALGVVESCIEAVEREIARGKA